MAAPQDNKKDGSRGRKPTKSTGRGGAGNMKTSDGGRNADEYSPTRGLELSVDGDTTKPLGRGGVGNILTQTRTRAAAHFSEGHPHTKALVMDTRVKTVTYERSIIERTSTEASGVRTSGRGGSGNISRGRLQSKGPGPSLGLFKRKKRDRPRRPAQEQTADRDDSPVRPREDGVREGGAQKNKGMGARAKRVHAFIRLRRTRVPRGSCSTPSSPAPAGGAPRAAPRLAPEFEPELEPVSSSSTCPHHRVSMLSIRTNISSLSYSRLSGISLPPSPDLYTPVSARDGADDAEDAEGGEESGSDETIFELYPPDSPVSDSGSASTAPSSLWSEKDPAQRPLSPYHCVFEFPDVPATARPRFLVPKAHAHARSISTPSLPTLYEEAATGSFVDLS